MKTRKYFTNTNKNIYILKTFRFLKKKTFRFLTLAIDHSRRTQYRTKREKRRIISNLQRILIKSFPQNTEPGKYVVVHLAKNFDDDIDDETSIVRRGPPDPEEIDLQSLTSQWICGYKMVPGSFDILGKGIMKCNDIILFFFSFFGCILINKSHSSIFRSFYSCC